MNDLENIPISFSTVNDKNQFALHGDDKFDHKKNRKILMSTIRFIKNLPSFDEQRF